MVPQRCGWNLRHLHVATLTKVLRDIANALDYMHSERCMAHGNVGLSTTMIQLTHSIYRMCAVFEALQDILWQALILLLKRKVVNVTANHFKLTSIFLEKKAR